MGNPNTCNRLNSLALVLPLLFVVAYVVGCDQYAPPPPAPTKPAITAIYCSLDEGWLVSDDIYFTNKSGKDLHEVRVKIKCIGVKGDATVNDRYWAIWSDQEQKMVSLSIGADETVMDVQRIDMNGECEEGYFAMYWTPKAPKE